MFTLSPEEPDLGETLGTTPTINDFFGNPERTISQTWFKALNSHYQLQFGHDQQDPPHDMYGDEQRFPNIQDLVPRSSGLEKFADKLIKRSITSDDGKKTICLEPPLSFPQEFSESLTNIAAKVKKLRPDIDVYIKEPSGERLVEVQKTINPSKRAREIIQATLKIQLCNYLIDLVNQMAILQAKSTPSFSVN